MFVLESDLSVVAMEKYGDLAQAGWGPRLRRRFGYYTPDDYYEAALNKLAGPETRWLDVGCGREILPFSPAASRALSARVKSLTGVDPSDNIDDNPYLHHRAKCMLEDFYSDEPFDLISLRMVVEHVTDPPAAAGALARLCRIGGRVLIYTVDKYSPVSLVSAATPIAFHHRVKGFLWGGEERDTFPTAYLMNTRGRLASLMSAAGFEEEHFCTLSDTRTTNRFYVLNVVELALWRACRAVGLDYPEKCLLGVYRRVAAEASKR
jgi:2-polyprenyl-3-methyl-5-hydroxy-6-metoxy-1,4-benzoquinol methylase